MASEKPSAARAGFLRNRYAEKGLDALTKKEQLELLFGYLMPKDKASASADDVLEKFGTVSAFLHASPAELKSAGCFNDQATLLISLLPYIHCLAVSSNAVGTVISNRVDACGLFHQMLAGLPDERLMCCCLSKSYKVKYCGTVSFGETDAVRFKSEALIELAEKYRSKAVIIAHNHTLSTSVPSVEDIESTKTLCRKLARSGILLLDHIVVGLDGARSLIDYESGDYSELILGGSAWEDRVRRKEKRSQQAKTKPDGSSDWE